MSLALLSLIFFIISLVFAIVNNELRSATIWALWAVWAAIALGTVRL